MAATSLLNRNRWSPLEEQFIIDQINQNKQTKDICLYLGRSHKGCMEKIKKLQKEGKVQYRDRRLTKEELETIIEMADQGYSYNDIAKHFGTGYKNIHSYIAHYYKTKYADEFINRINDLKN